MAIGNGELMHECFPKNSRIGTAKNEIRQRNKKQVKRDAWKEVKRARKKSTDGLSPPNQNTIIININ